MSGSGQPGDDDQAFYGDFGLGVGANPPADPAYKIYRKYGARSEPDLEGTMATNTPGNVSSMDWSGMYHSGDTGIIDPGMWIGTGAATSSPADQLLYFKPAIDEGGGGNDENFRRDWDLRFGFLEDPNNFVDSREPNDESWDLWSGEWNTDGISGQLNIGTNEFGDESDWYVRRAGFRMNASESVFGNETERFANDWSGLVYAGSGDDLDPFDGTNTYAGVGYDDAIEISWKMEPAAPDSREVIFTVKVGNTIQEGIFDPGAADDPVAPNADDESFSDGFFDWQNATPVFFVAPTGGAEASGTMGVFIPGDFNADGTVNDDDRAIITAFMDQTDTTYSRGDLNQDGFTNAADLTAFDALGNQGDPKEVLATITDPQERIDFVHDVLGTWMGDSNCDGEFNSSDFVQVFQAGQYEDGVAGNSTWATGDWNGDKDFDSSDFVSAFQDGGFEIGPRPVASVPEPSGLALAALAMVGLIVRRRC